MIQEFVDRFMAAQPKLREQFSQGVVWDYSEIVKRVVEAITTDDYSEVPDPERITRIDHGDYQGTTVYVVAEKGYQPSQYWATHNYYGSCSGCDTLQALNEGSWSYEDDARPTTEVVDGYMTLALHIVQRFKEVT